MTLRPRNALALPPFLLLAGLGLGYGEVPGAAAMLALALPWGGALLLFAMQRAPARRLAAAADRITGGDLQTPVPDQDRADALGAVARALEVLRARLEADRAQSLPAPSLEGLVLRFGEDATAPLRALRRAADALQAGATMLGAPAGVAAPAADTTELAAARAASDHLLASAALLEKQTAQAAEAATQAGAAARQGGASLDRILAEAAAAGAEVALVTKVAEQARMLGMNAAIEAVRSGAAGGGVALLAADARALARQSAEAAAASAARIDQLQAAAATAAGRLQDIDTAIASLDAAMANMAAAVEGQGEAVRTVAEGLGSTAAALRRSATTAEQVASGQDRAARALRQTARAVGDQARVLSLGVERLVRAA